MALKSKIEWTDHTFNPWWGCTKVSPGCTNCYAEVWANRYGHDVWGTKKERRLFSDNHWKQPLLWNKKAKLSGIRPRIFCASMADVFEDNPLINNERERLWKLIDKTQNLDWLLLTKRPENMIELSPWGKNSWPTNVWAMISVENQKIANQRLPNFLNVPSSIKGISVEPLLEELDLSPWITNLDWIIVGGESGKKARSMNISWVRKIRDLCLAHNVAFFFKQWGNWMPSNNNEMEMVRKSKKEAGRLLDGKEWNELPVSSGILTNQFSVNLTYEPSSPLITT